MILVTGGTGLVGSHLLLQLLKDNKSVRALYRTEASLLKPKKLFDLYNVFPLYEKIEWCKGDITDLPSLEVAFQNVSKVYHAAALISFSDNQYDTMYKINIEGTANMVNMSLINNVEKFCYVSSVAALGHAKEPKDCIDEATDWLPEKVYDDYSITKYGAELEVWRGVNEGLNAVMVNPGVIIGPGFWETGSGKLFSTLKKGVPFYTDGVTGYVDVNDVVEVMIQLMKSEVVYERFCLVSENVSYKNIFQEIAMALSVKVPYAKANKILTFFYAKLTNVLCFLGLNVLPISASMVRFAHTENFYSSAKIINALNFRFKSISESIKETAKFYKKN